MAGGPDDLKSQLEALKSLQADARRYFDRVGRELSAEAQSYRSDDRDALWKASTDELKRVAGDLTSRLIQLVTRTTGVVARSPILSEADRLQLGIGMKTMRAAIRLRRFRYWEPEVIHDEDRPIGIRPASQSDDFPATPAQARRSFDEAVDSVEAVIEMCGAEVTTTTIHTTERGPAAAVRPGTAFLMMWMDPRRPELTDVADAAKRCFARFDIEAVRADDIEHEDVITARILDQIRTSELLFADLTGERPSVYYEVGYAHSLGRRVMLYRRAGTAIHFDLAAYNCPEYANLRELEAMLTKRLQEVTGQKPTESRAKRSAAKNTRR